jgi:opacity protein-like surface antigen
MTQLRRMTFILFLLLLLSELAFAGAESSYYVGGYLGVPVQGTSKATDTLGSFNLETDPGGLLALTFGYRLPPGGVFGDGRVEIEYSFRNNGISTLKFSDGTFPATGDISVQALILNSFAAYPLSPRVNLYWGVGIGGALLKVDQLTVESQPLISDKVLTFAYQGGVGMIVDLTTSLQLDFGYRYFALFQPELNEVDGRRVELDYNAHTGLIGLIYKF